MYPFFAQGYTQIPPRISSLFYLIYLTIFSFHSILVISSLTLLCCYCLQTICSLELVCQSNFSSIMIYKATSHLIFTNDGYYKMLSSHWKTILFSYIFNLTMRKTFLAQLFTCNISLKQFCWFVSPSLAVETCIYQSVADRESSSITGDIKHSFRHIVHFK